MFARISTWRATVPDYDILAGEMAPFVSDVTRQSGYITGYVVRPAPDTTIIVSLWETEEQMNAAFDTALPGLRSAIERGGLQMTDAVSGPARQWK